MISAPRDPTALFNRIDDTRWTPRQLVAKVAIAAAALLVIIVVGLYALVGGALLAFTKKAAR